MTNSSSNCGSSVEKSFVLFWKVAHLKSLFLYFLLWERVREDPSHRMFTTRGHFFHMFSCPVLFVHFLTDVIQRTPWRCLLIFSLRRAPRSLAAATVTAHGVYLREKNDFTAKWGFYWECLIHLRVDLIWKVYFLHFMFSSFKKFHAIIALLQTTLFKL